MKILLNDTFSISKVFRVNEVINENLIKKIVIQIAYSQDSMKAIENFFNTNQTIDTIKLFKDDSLVCLYKDYKKLENIFHHSSDVLEQIEIVLKQE